MNKRVFLLVAVFVVSAGTTYFLLRPNPKSQTERALTHLKQNNFKAAETALKSLRAHSTGYPEPLYRGYLEQWRERFDLSDHILHTAFNEAKKGGNQKVMQEILVARATNAFCEQRDEDLHIYVEAAHKLPPLNSGVTFLQGLQHYLNFDYAEALHLWNHSTPVDITDWASLSLEKFFPPFWRKLHAAHCLIENGEILAGREILEKESHTFADDPELHHLAALFLGLSYIKEAHTLPIEQRGSYYQMACFYFEHAQGSEQYSREKNRAITHIEEAAKGLLLVTMDPEKRVWGFDFIHMLQGWKAGQAVSRLADYVANNMIEHKGIASIRFCESLRSEFLGTPFHQQLTEKMTASLAQTLKNGESDDLFEHWALVESLAPHPKLVAKEIASLTCEEIFETIQKDNLLLTRTRHYIAFWEQLGRNAGEREVLARDLLYNAKLFWYNEKQEKKGLRLMEIALKISNHSPYIEREIGSFLTTLYEQAENSNMIRRLTLIYDAMEHFEINRQELGSKTTLANHLADAEYLYDARNYLAAKTHAIWVLKLDPHNENARRLAGLCAFNLGEFNRALCHLKELKNLDEDTSKALMLAQVFSSQEQGKHLCQNDASDSFDDNE